MEILRREAVTPGEALEFVLSDGSRDRHGTRINPNGWDLAAFRRNPVALFGHNSDFLVGRWENVRVEGGRLIGTLKLAAKGTSQRIDELIGLVEQGILRAVSVGFSVIKAGDGKQWEFEKQELHECSLVSVGSNKNALALARSLNVSDETLSLAFGEQADDGREEVQPGKQAAKTTSIAKGIARMDTPLTKRIENAQNDLNAARDALTEHLADDNADTTQTEALSSEIEVREDRLASLKRAEKALASRAAGNDGDEGGNLPKPNVRRPLGVKLREPKPGDLMIRAGAVHAIAYINQRDPLKVLEERYGDHEATNVFVRAAVDPAKTTVSGWASELIETEVLSFLESLKPVSIFPRLAELGISLNFGPGRAALKIPSRTSSPSISGSFVAEGSPIPVRRFGLTSVTLSPHKLGVISYFTREIARLSNPQIESLIREYIQDDTAITLDTLLLDSNASSSTRPAGLTNGVAALTASASGGYQAILEDIQTLAAPFDSANAGRRLALILNPREARLLKMTPGPNASGFGWADQFLSEFTVIRSTNVTAGHVYMIDAADFAAAVGAPEFDVSEQAVLHAEDTSPAQISTAGTPVTLAHPTISMFQTASIALRMLSDTTWAMRRSGMVQHIAAVDWAPA